MYEDPSIVIVRLTSTHGELFIRTKSDFEPWTRFVNWIDVKQSNMHGYKSRRHGTAWNGFDVSEHASAAAPGVVERVVEMEGLFQKHACVAIWKTEDFGDGSISVPEPDED
jgi:hypothetical protein